MGKWEIAPRMGITVYLNDGGDITIKQHDRIEEDNYIVVHPDDVSTLIRYLEEACQELRENLALIEEAEKQ